MKKLFEEPKMDVMNVMFETVATDNNDTPGQETSSEW